MSISKSIAINTLSQILGKICVVILGVLGTIILRRYLGRSFYGDYIYVISIATMLASLADFGSHLITVREASQEEKNQGIIIANVFILRLIFVAAAFLILIILSFIPSFTSGPGLQEQSLKLPIIFAGLIIISLSLKNFLTIIFHIKLKLFYYSLMNFLTGVLAIAGTIFLVRLKIGGGILFFVLNLGFANFLPFLVFLPLAFNLIPLKFKFNQKIMKNVLFQTAPMGGILLLFTLYSKIDTIILKLYQGSDAVGVYGLSYKIHDNLNVIAAYLMNSLLPIFSRLSAKKRENKRFKKLFQTSFDILLFGGAFLAIIIFLFASPIIKILTGEFLNQEIFCLKILVLATFLSFLNHLMGYSIIALRQQSKSFFIAGAALAFNLVANLIFIPFFSFKAAAINTVLTEGLVLFLSGRVIYKKLAWFPKFTYFPKTITAIIKNKGRIFD